MAKFRKNHKLPSNNKSYIFRSIAIICILIFISFGFGKMIMKFLCKKETPTAQTKDWLNDSEEYIPSKYVSSEDKYELIHHRHYSLGYDESMELARWVGYELTKKSLLVPNVERTNWYSKDTLVSSGSANYYDYKGSGYSRGHLAPAGDMAFDTLAMRESFYMSNMAPQLKIFNGGIWNELEQNVRDWAYDKERLIIITGPYFFDQHINYIGENRVAVPPAFYKAILDPATMQSIAFVIPHEVSDLKLEIFASSINQLEADLKMNLFTSYYSSETEEEMNESSFELEYWPMPEYRYKERVHNWNKKQ